MPLASDPQPTQPLLCLVCPIFDGFRSANLFPECPQPKLETACQNLTRDLTVFGDLWLFRPIEQAFSEAEIRLVQQVASQCAIGLRQARLYKAFQSQMAQLESLHRLKEDFLNTISHELRTPLSNIKMCLYMLRKTQDEARRQQYLDILERECSREIELINDLLDLQRLEAGMDTPLLEPVDLADWIPAQLRAFQGSLDYYQQTLRVELDPSVSSTGPHLWSDPRRLSRILGELINNACKYTAPGETIHLRVHWEPEQVRFEITNPAEIPADQLPYLFNKFYRVPNGDPWKRGGTGLGLALVKQLVEQLGGKIDVSSHAGLTTFGVVIPNRRWQSDPQAVPLPVALPQA